MPSPVITLTTDFGQHDPFAGIMKGVILRINPEVTIVDISNEIRPYDIREAALTIGMSYEFFPNRSIHVVVVDPGVGSVRRPIMVTTDHHYFIGPDNGVFSAVYAREKGAFQVTHITATHYFLSSKSPTFQARDVFAPAAAYLSRGVHVSKFGDAISDFCSIPLPAPQMTENGVRGEVILIDRFGNSLTNIRRSDIDAIADRPGDANMAILLNGREIPLRGFYAQGPERELSALFNSSGFLEFFVHRGDASSLFQISPGTGVEVLVKR